MRTIVCGRCKGRKGHLIVAIPFWVPCEHCGGLGTVDLVLHVRTELS